MLEALFQDAPFLRLIGIASALLSIFAYLPYIRHTLAGRTQPQRTSWLIWSVLGTIALASQAYEGAQASLWFAAIQVSGTITIFLLSVRYGTGSFVTKADAGALWVAAAGLVIWVLTDTAVYALAITITISLMGGSMTILKAYRAPQSETLSTWATSCVAAGLAMVAVGHVHWVLLAYPLYLFVLNGGIVAAILLGRARGAPAPLYIRRYTKNAAH
ncbi:hypothetical protein [uncultured Tateyamaria sp.]|uniref:hypothetical protein n=1 Tax=uncultured Tateyamaria sp. TaxID=455651 RepID=UPI00262335E2|nr:hypothetical protein [uncultured Tateyamaria sp.]